jgi:hypothetical protein
MTNHLQEAANLLTAARKELEGLEDSEPVEQRRKQVRAAQLLRRAANQLDDYGTLTE